MTITKHKMRNILLTLVFVMMMSACSTNSDDGGLSLFGAEPTQLNSSSAESVFTTFLDAWVIEDYETMYSLISPNARDSFTFNAFQSIYDGVDVELGIRNISWQIIAGPLVQGTSATVEYSVDFETDVVGDFSDPNPEDTNSQPRTMYLIATESEGWRVAWSRMDIFMGWTNSSNLRVERTMPRRGNIYDRNGEILVSQNGTVIGIFVIENNMRNIEQCRDELARILRREREDIQREFDRWAPDTRFLIGEVPEDVANRENNVLNSICNYDAFSRSTRQYYGRVAPHVIGYIGQIQAEEAAVYLGRGYPVGALVGQSGIELAFEEELRGTIGKRLLIESNTGVPIRTITRVDAVPGTSVYLTIDRDLQLGVQQMLAEAYDAAIPTWSNTSDGAAVVVMNVNTGEILAMASYPDYDPSVFNPDTPVYDAIGQISEWKADTRRPLLNRATNGRYPLGSVFKVFTMITALDSGYWALDNQVTCTGTWDGSQWNAGVRTDWLLTGHGTLDMQGSLINSCNPYNWQLSTTLNAADPTILPTYARLYGFGQAPPLQGVLTDPGLVPDPDYMLRINDRQWAYSDAADFVIGQGDLQVNPLQVARATAMVANGGNLPTPIIVQRIQTLGQDPTFVATPNSENLGIDPTVIQATQDAMCQVTRYSARYSGTAAFIFDDGWYQENDYQILVCGKTGTAQTGLTQPHAWFNAFAPAESPEIAIAIIVENSCEGSEVAAPMTRRILELYYPQLRTDGFNWPEPIWTGSCTQIGPGSTG